MFMKLIKLRRLATRRVIAPLALFALVIASSAPVSAHGIQNSQGNQNNQSTTTQTHSHTGGVHPYSINW